MNYLPVLTSHRLVRALPGRERRSGCLDQRAELGLGSTSSESAGKDLSSYTIVSLLSPNTFRVQLSVAPMISLSHL